jgi:hypothetical protein
MRMLAAGVVSGLDSDLKVEHVQIVADNDVILVVEAVEAEFGHDSALPFQRSSLVEFGGLLAQPLGDGVTRQLARQLQQPQGSRAKLRHGKVNGCWHSGHNRPLS